MPRQETYHSSTMGPIPLSFTGRRLMQNLREAFAAYVQLKVDRQRMGKLGLPTDWDAVSRARGELAQYISKLERNQEGAWAEQYKGNFTWRDPEPVEAALKRHEEHMKGGPVITPIVSELNIAGDPFSGIPPGRYECHAPGTAAEMEKLRKECERLREDNGRLVKEMNTLKHTYISVAQERDDARSRNARLAVDLSEVKDANEFNLRQIGTLLGQVSDLQATLLTARGDVAECEKQVSDLQEEAKTQHVHLPPIPDGYELNIVGNVMSITPIQDISLSSAEQEIAVGYRRSSPSST